MTQEDKELLLIDLCARLPYSPIVQILNLEKLDKDPYLEYLSPRKLMNMRVFEIKPYFRPMSSMTEGEYKEFCKISGLHKKEEGNYFTNHLPEWGNSVITERVMVRTIDWLNAHHFDYRGLIEKGLAIAVTKENNPYERF